MKIYVYYCYLLSNYTKTVLYIGVTNDLTRRVFEHLNKLTPGFTTKYNVNRLVYYEQFDDIELAIRREKQLKGYSRAKKNILIDSFNPNWDNLYENGQIKW